MQLAYAVGQTLSKQTFHPGERRSIGRLAWHPWQAARAAQEPLVVSHAPRVAPRPQAQPAAAQPRPGGRARASARRAPAAPRVSPPCGARAGPARPVIPRAGQGRAPSRHPQGYAVRARPREQAERGVGRAAVGGAGRCRALLRRAARRAARRLRVGRRARACVGLAACVAWPRQLLGSPGPCRGRSGRGRERRPHSSRRPAPSRGGRRPARRVAGVPAALLRTAAAQTEQRAQPQASTALRRGRQLRAALARRSIAAATRRRCRRRARPRAGHCAVGVGIARRRRHGGRHARARSTAARLRGRRARIRANRQ